MSLGNNWASSNETQHPPVIAVCMYVLCNCMYYVTVCMIDNCYVGGYSYRVTDEIRLRRFLCLGVDGKYIHMFYQKHLSQQQNVFVHVFYAFRWCILYY